MQNITILLAQHPSSTSIAKLSRQLKGKLTEDGARIDLNAGSALVHIDFHCDIKEYENEEIDSFAKMLGCRPVAVVSIHFRNNEESEILGLASARSICEHWIGVIDENP